MPIFGRDDIFYDLLERQANYVMDGAREFGVLVANMGDAAVHAESLKRLEDDADTLKHELNNVTDARFITPFDKEDIQSLAGELDDILDLIEATSARVVLFRLDTPHPDLEIQVKFLAKAVEATSQAVQGLRHLKDHKRMHEMLKRIHEVENENDQAYRNALGALFGDTKADPLMVMKWKEIFDRMEAAVDKCEDVAVTLEKIAVKYA
jgi:hypothetical protein